MPPINRTHSNREKLIWGEPVLDDENNSRETTIKRSNPVEQIEDDDDSEIQESSPPPGYKRHSYPSRFFSADKYISQYSSENLTPRRRPRGADVGKSIHKAATASQTPSPSALSELRDRHRSLGSAQRIVPSATPELTTETARRRPKGVGPAVARKTTSPTVPMDRRPTASPSGHRIIGLATAIARKMAPPIPPQRRPNLRKRKLEHLVGTEVSTQESRPEKPASRPPSAHPTYRRNMVAGDHSASLPSLVMPDGVRSQVARKSALNRVADTVQRSPRSAQGLQHQRQLIKAARKTSAQHIEQEYSVSELSQDSGNSDSNESSWSLDLPALPKSEDGRETSTPGRQDRERGVKDLHGDKSTYGTQSQPPQCDTSNNIPDDRPVSSKAEESHSDEKDWILEDSDSSMVSPSSPSDESDVSTSRSEDSGEEGKGPNRNSTSRKHSGRELSDTSHITSDDEIHSTAAKQQSSERRDFTPTKTASSHGPGAHPPSHIRSQSMASVPSIVPVPSRSLPSKISPSRSVVGVVPSSPPGIDDDAAPPQPLITAFEALSVYTLHFHRKRRLPFLLRNVRASFRAWCRKLHIGTFAEHPLRHGHYVPLEYEYTAPSGTLYTYNTVSGERECPLCSVFSIFPSWEALVKHVQWDHREIEFEVRRGDVAGKEVKTIIMRMTNATGDEEEHKNIRGFRDSRRFRISSQRSRSLDSPPSEAFKEDSSQDFTLSLDEENVDPRHVPDSRPSVSPAHSKDSSPCSRTHSIAAAPLERLATPNKASNPHQPVAPKLEPDNLPESHFPRSPVPPPSSAPPHTSTSRPTSTFISPISRLLTPPPPSDPYGPAHPIVAGGVQPRTYRPTGPHLYDHLSSLPLETFGHRSWFILDKEEEIFELTDVLDEDKVICALWGRWILLNRPFFVADYLLGVKAFVDEYWLMIHRAAGWGALRAWLMMLVSRRFLRNLEMVQVLKKYNNLTRLAQST